ncbi:uncharacterized protein LOC144631651 [Oculina patagonica]
MLLRLLFILCLATLCLNGVVCGPVSVLFQSNGQSLKLGEIKLRDHQEVRVHEHSSSCNRGNKGLLRMSGMHIEFCDGQSWVQLLDKNVSLKSSAVIGVDCKDIKKQGYSTGDGMYWLDPDGGSAQNAFQAYCDMTSYNGGWTMCYTTADTAKPRTEVTYNPQLLYGSDGYRSNCNNIPFTEIIFIDHQTGNKAYFKRKSNLPMMAELNYGKPASAFGLWEGVETNKAYSYQLLICNDPFYSGFFVSGYTSNCYKKCDAWCGDTKSPYFRTRPSNPSDAQKGVAFNTNGHVPNVPKNRLMSVGLR